MLIEMPPHQGEHLARVSPCPFCGAKMLGYVNSASFYHPGAVSDADCVLNGKGFRYDQIAQWEARTPSPEGSPQ